MSNDARWILEANPKHEQLRARKDPELNTALDELASFLGDLPAGGPPPFTIPGRFDCQICHQVYLWTAAQMLRCNVDAARKHATAAAVFCTGCGQPVWAYELPMNYVWKEDGTCKDPGRLHTHSVLWGARTPIDA